MSEEIIQKLHKIRELAERGSTPGERANARRKINELLNKYGLEYESVFQEKQELDWASYTYSDQYQKQILIQCFFTITKSSQTHIKEPTQSRIAFQVTPWQALELAHMYSYYRKLWKQQVKEVLEMFLSKHKLIRSRSDKEPKEEDIDFDQLEKLTYLYQGMKNSKYVSTRQMLEEGSQLDTNCKNFSFGFSKR